MEDINMGCVRVTVSHSRYWNSGIDLSFLCTVACYFNYNWAIQMWYVWVGVVMIYNKMYNTCTNVLPCIHVHQEK